MAAVNNVPKDIQDAIREYLGRRVKLYIKRMVKQELRPDKWENRVLAFSGSRLFVFTTKPSKSPQEHNICYLDIQSVESKKPNKLAITTYEGKSYSFVTLETETDEVNHMITHMGTSVKQIFPSFPLERIIKKIDVQPAERLKMMNDMVKTIESKEHGPCGNFAMMYACMCDYFNLPYREEVAWDVDTIYLSQDCRTLSLKDFDHLNGRDLQPIVSSIEHNTWFTGLDLSGVKMTSETQGEVLKVMHKNCLIEDLNLSNTGISVEFVTKLGTAILSNTGSQLTRIDLSKNVLDDKAMISFLGSLSNLSRGLTQLNISNTKLTGKGLNKVFEIMIQHDSIFSGIQYMNFSDNPSKGEDLQQMYKFLANPNGILQLDLSGIECALENLMVALHRGCTSVTHLFLARNVYTHKKMKEVVVQPSWKQFFASICNVEHLDLANCKIPVEALKELLLGISSNMHLPGLHLYIGGNDFQQAGSLNIESTIANIYNITSLDISNNNLDQGLATLLPWIKTNKNLKRLWIGRNFDHLRQKQLPSVLEGVVQLIQDEDCGIETLSLADSKLKHNIAVIINALGSNVSLTELDISGNHMSDFGARMLSKALQINNKLKTIIWDKNGTGCQGFEDIALALEKNYTVKRMPTPVNDVVLAQQKQPERTEAAIQRIEVLLQRNHSPQKYLVNRDYKIQGCYLSSTQQMVDRLVVQVQDTINALQITPSADEYKEDIDAASDYVKDANNSQLLLPQLQDIADKSVGESNPVDKRLKDISHDLKKVLDVQMKKTVEDMMECTNKQLTAISKDKEFSTDLNNECGSRSSLPVDFAIHSLNVVEMDIFNKISELNLSVAAHISDRVIDAVIENLSSSHKKLTNHLNVEKSKQGRLAKAKEEAQEAEKGDKQEKDNTEDSKSESKSSDSSPVSSPGLALFFPQHIDTPNIASKRKTLNDRRKRPPTVIEAEHVKKALEVYNSVDPVPDEATPTPCPGTRVKNIPTTSNDTDVSMTTVRESEELKEATVAKKVGSQEDLTAHTELNVIPEKQKKPAERAVSSIPDLPMETGPSLQHLGKDRPKRPRTRRPGRPTTPATNMVEKEMSTEESSNIDVFFKPLAATNQTTAPVTTPKTEPEKEKDKKVARKASTDGKADGGKSRFLFGNKDKKEKEKEKEFSPKEKQSKTTMLGRLGFGKQKTVKEPEKKEEVKSEPKSEPVESKESNGTIDKENTEPEKTEETKPPPEKEEPQVEEKTNTKEEKEEEAKEVEKPKKALRPPIGGMGMGFTGEMMTQLKLRQQNRKSTGKLPEDEPPKEKEKEKVVLKPVKTEKTTTEKTSEPKPSASVKPTTEKTSEPKPSAPVSDTSESKTADKIDETQSKIANNTSETKQTPDKTAPKSVLQIVHDSNRPKPAPRPGQNRISTGSRTSTSGEDSEGKGPKPAPKPRPNPPPKPRSSVKSDVLAEEKPSSPRSSSSDKRSSTESEKSASLPRTVPPVTDKVAEKISRPASMFAEAIKGEKETLKTLTSSKSSGELTDSNDLVKDLKKIVEDENKGDNQDEKKDVKTSNGEKEDVNSGNGEKRDSNTSNDKKQEDSKDSNEKNDSDSKDSKRSSAENLVSGDTNGKDETEFENDVIMV